MFNFIKNIFSKKTVISPITSTERESAVSLSKVKKEHIFRYNLAREIIENCFGESQTTGLDIFCANGYGTYFLGRFLTNTFITGIDGSKDAVKLAKKYYRNSNIKYFAKIYPFRLQTLFYDYIVCLESIEHISSGSDFLSDLYSALKDNGILIISTPNNGVLPLDKNPNKFHKLQYSASEFTAVLKKAGFKIETAYGQNLFMLDEQQRMQGLLPVYERKINTDINSQYMIFFCRK